MAFSFRDDYPILQPGATIDESLTSAAFGVAQPVLPKIVGSWAENFGPFAAATATSSVVYIAPYPITRRPADEVVFHFLPSFFVLIFPVLPPHISRAREDLRMCPRDSVQ